MVHTPQTEQATIDHLDTLSAETDGDKDKFLFALTLLATAKIGVLHSELRDAVKRAAQRFGMTTSLMVFAARCNIMEQKS